MFLGYTNYFALSFITLFYMPHNKTIFYFSVYTEQEFCLALISTGRRKLFWYISSVILLPFLHDRLKNIFWNIQSMIVIIPSYLALLFTCRTTHHDDTGTAAKEHQTHQNIATRDHPKGIPCNN